MLHFDQFIAWLSNLNSLDIYFLRPSFWRVTGVYAFLTATFFFSSFIEVKNFEEKNIICLLLKETISSSIMFYIQPSPFFQFLHFLLLSSASHFSDTYSIPFTIRFSFLFLHPTQFTKFNMALMCCAMIINVKSGTGKPCLNSRLLLHSLSH